MSAQPHIVFIPSSARSHIRLLFQLSLNLLSIHPSLVNTFLVTSLNAPFLREEASIQRHELMTAVAGRWQIVEIDVGLEPGTSPLVERVALEERLNEPLKVLIGGKGKPGFQVKPCAFICDVFRVFVSQAIRTVTEDLSVAKIPIVIFVPTMAVYQYRNILPESEGGSGVSENGQQRFEGCLKEGMSELEAARTALCNVKNTLTNYPDLPPMYDYEFAPQSTSIPYSKGYVFIMSLTYYSVRQVDALIVLSTPELDGKALECVANVLGYPVFGIGPQFSETTWDTAKQEIEKESQVDSEQDRVIGFLDAALREHGPRCAAYISLGTLNWPTRRPSVISTIITSLLEVTPSIPFIFATASERDKMDPELKKSIEASGRGMVVDWAPQIQVLKHAATGMFLTHCGSGSVTEAILSGIPIIALPFIGDQPVLAAYFTQIYKLGVQLYQLSCGLEGLTLGNGVVVTGTEEAMQYELKKTWTLMRGEEAEKFRANIAEVRDLMKKSKDSGMARANMVSLVEGLISGSISRSLRT